MYTCRKKKYLERGREVAIKEMFADKESGVLVLVEEEYVSNVTLFLRSLDYVVFVLHMLGGWRVYVETLFDCAAWTKYL
jgi:hypothetical protein